MHIDLADSNRPVRLLQLTDCHVGESVGEKLLGLDTDESLQDVIEHVVDSGQIPDLLVVTGDISNNGGAFTYKRFLTLIESSNINHRAFAWLPGNHDAPSDMNFARGDEQLVKKITAGNWLIVLLNTQVPGHTHGNLTPEELATLNLALRNHEDRHVLIFLHHQPVPVGCAWLDNQKIKSSEAFFNLLDEYPHVKAVVWGHVHQEFNGSHNHIQLMATPSTCIQFKPNSDEFAIDHTMPGYRWLYLYPDGSLETEVHRVDKKKYAIDFESAGY